MKLMINTLTKIIPFIGLFSLAIISGCSQEQQEVTAAPEPVIIQNGEECDLCGMYINRFPGPKGQVFERGGLTAKRFCSTRDLFAYALQPEHQHRVEHIYVHDVATAPWDEQEKAQYIDAKTAIFVTGHSLKGAMGPALASFSKQEDAENFAAEFGGELLKFSDIDIDTLSAMSHQAMHHH
mgnify:CR=1 FL=1